jgi:hypothetical protein
VIGGFQSPNFCEPTSYVEKYFVANDTWESVASMHYGRGDLAVGKIGNSVFSVGGETKDSTCSKSLPVSIAERYNLNQSYWDPEEGYF